MPSRDPLVAECQRLLAEGMGAEEIIGMLRYRGCSKIDSIAIMKLSMAIPLNQAKKLVHFSKAWEDLRDAHDKFHDSLEQALQEAEKMEA